MSDTASNFAMMISGSNVVQNVIKATSGTSIPGFSLIAVADGTCCNPGSYYNDSDGKFYTDSAFTTLTGTVTDSSTDTASITYMGVSDLAAQMQVSDTTSSSDETTS